VTASTERPGPLTNMFDFNRNHERAPMLILVSSTGNP
jgi:hypothetical protein